MSDPYRRCPVCWQPVGATPHRRNIQRHWDSAGRDICPMSGELFEMAMAVSLPKGSQVA